MSVDVRVSSAPAASFDRADDGLRATVDGLVDTTSRLIRMIARERAGIGSLTTSQVLLLAVLDELGPTRITRLAAYERCSQPAMTTLVARLEGQGMVRRSVDESDRRAVLVSITALGRARLGESRNQLSARLMDRLRDLSPEQRQRLGAAVEEIHGLLVLSEAPTHRLSDTNHVSGPVPGA